MEKKKIMEKHLNLILDLDNKIPGFLHFYKNLSCLLNKAYIDRCLIIEKNLRKYFGKNPIIIKDEFYEIE